MSINIQDRYLKAVTTTWFSDFQYLGVGTVNTTNTGTENGLYGAVQIGTTASLFNKIFDSGTTSYIQTGSVSFVRLFKLNTLQPNSQPVILREIGGFQTQTGTTDMISRSVLNVGQTKDSSISWIVRFSGKVNRVSGA